MPPARAGLVVLRLATLAALAASAMLFADYVSIDPVFCDGASGCAAVRKSVLAQFGPRPLNLPLVGWLAFAALLTVSFPGDRLSRRLTDVGALVAGALGLALLLVQWVVIGAFCPLCGVVDAAAVLAGLTRLAPARLREAPAPDLAPGGWVALALLVTAAPALYRAVGPAEPLPEPIAALATPGRVTVVALVDAQCSHCRKLHPTLRALEARWGERASVRYVQTPLASHSAGIGAALATACAEEQEPVGERRFGHSMFDAPTLDYPTFERLVTERGLDVERWRTCMESDRPATRLAADLELFRAAGVPGVPVTFVGPIKVPGAASAVELEASFERAAAGGGGGTSALPFWASLLLPAAAIVALLRRPHRTSGGAAAGANLSS